MDIHSYQEARKHKNKDYDGKFFFAVKTTGIFCRPSCPSPVALEKNVTYYNSIYEALEEGYRPCLRCRPDVQVDYYNGNVDGAVLVEKALELIYDGFLNENKVSDLANTLSVSGRHLRMLFVENIGIPPVKVAKYHKALFAKKLLFSSSMRITDIAYAAGFGSIRQFNHVMKEVHGLSPSEIREKKLLTEPSTDGMTVIHLMDNLVKSFNVFLSHKNKYSIRGVEIVDENYYARTFSTEGYRGYYQVVHNIKKKSLLLIVHTDHIKSLMKIYNHVKRFDHFLNADETAWIDSNSKEMSESLTCRKLSAAVKKSSLKTPDDYPDGLDYYIPNLKAEIKDMSVEL